jgi:PBP1b-binding outer membrane lipoprotein LpoB
MKFFHALIALLFTAALLAGCNKTEESAPADSAQTAPAAPAADAAPAGDAAAPAADAAAPAEPPKEEPGGWVPPAEGS